MPWNDPGTDVGTSSSARSLLIWSTASLSEAPGARLKDSVTAGNWPW